jgi:MoxR-like ATPase
VKKIASLILNTDKSRSGIFRPELQSFIEQASLVLVDKEAQLRLAWCCIAAGGHLLIEDVPGMGKTTMVKLIAKLFDLPFKRIQCTSDLLPADITGGSIFDEKKHEFSFNKGPLFSNLVMADELNRASPKSQSAFLQAMEEGFVTVDGVTHELPTPFIVIATQNAMDSAGTNPLPESQLDRFMMTISLGLPARNGERRLLMESSPMRKLDGIQPLISPGKLLDIRDEVNMVHVSEKVADYILNLATWIRQCADGCSPRALISLAACAKAWAFSEGRDYLLPLDIQAVAPAVWGHRLVLKNDAGTTRGNELVKKAIASVEVDV